MFRDYRTHVANDLEKAKNQTRDAQKALQAYQRSRRGLPQSTESLKEQRRLDLAIGKRLDQQLDLEDKLKSLEREIERKKWPKMQRVR